MDNTILTFSPEDLITTSGKYDKYNCTNISEIDMELTLVANTDPVRSNPFSDSMLNETVIEYSDATNDSPNNTFNRKNPFRNSLDYMEENLQDLSDSLEINTTIKHNYLNTSLVVNVSNNSTLSSLFDDEDGMLFKNNMASSVTPTNRISVITPLKNIELLEEKNGKPFESNKVTNFQRSFTPYTANKTHNVKDVTILYNINDSSYLNLNKIDIEQTSINFKKIEKIDFDITTTKTASDEECYQNDKQLLNLDESRVCYNSKEIKKEELKLSEQAYLKRPDLHTMQDQLFLNKNTSNNDSSSCVNFEATNVDMKLNKELVKHDQIKSNLIDRESNNINSLSSENLVEHTEEESDAEEQSDESNDISIDWDLINELWKKLYPTTSSNKQNTNTPNNHNIERVIKNEKENSSNQKTGIQKISDFPRNKKKSFCSEVCDDTHNIKDTIISLEQLDLSSENNFKGSASKELIKEGSILQKATVNNINSTNENTQSQERKNSQKINVTKNNYCNSKNRFITKNRKRFGGNYNKKTEGPNLSKDHRSIKKVIEKTQQKNLVGVWKVENIKDCNKKGEKENVNSFKGQKINKKFRKTCKYSIIPLKTEITKKMTFKEFTKEQKSESNYKENKQLYRCASGEFKADLLKNEFKKSNVLSEKVQLNNIINNLGGCSTISIKNDSNTLRNDSLKNDRKSHTFNKIKSAIMNMSLLQSRRESLQTTPYKEREDSCINLKDSTVDINNKSFSSNQFRKTKVEFKELIPNIFKKKSTAIQPQNKNVILKAIKPKNEIIDTEEHRIESTAINNKILNSTTNVDNVINSEESSEMKDFKIKSTQTLILNSSVKKATFFKEPKIADTDSVYLKVLPKLRISVKETDHGIEYTSHLVENCSNHVENSKDYINYRLGRCDEIISRRYTKRFHRNDPKKRLCRYQKYLQQSKKDIDLIKQSKKIICWALGDIKGNLTIVNGKNNN